MSFLFQLSHHPEHRCPSDKSYFGLLTQFTTTLRESLYRLYHFFTFLKSNCWDFQQFLFVSLVETRTAWLERQKSEDSRELLGYNLSLSGSSNLFPGTACSWQVF